MNARVPGKATNSGLAVAESLPASPSVWLSDHYPPLRSLLEATEGRILALASGGDGLLGQAGQYVVSGRGKRLRPALLLLAAEACGGANTQAVEMAAVVELIHTASLVHDDIVDEAHRRRGKASARSLWGNKISVLLGDYLLCRAFSHLRALEAAGALEELIAIAQQMCQAQVAELSEGGPDLSEARYLEILAGKTAALFRFCGKMGAQCANASEKAIQSLGNFAFSFGLAFQIADDIHDLIGSEEASGKPVNHDLRQRKITLPLIFSLRESKNEARDLLQRALANTSISEDDLAHIRRLAAECGGVEYAWSVCRQHLDHARQALETLPSPKEPAYQALLLTCGEGFPLPVMS